MEPVPGLNLNLRFISGLETEMLVTVPCNKENLNTYACYSAQN